MQTAHSEEWRPGFAKRAENFSDVVGLAESWRWSPGETIARVAGAVLKGTPTLTIPQRMTLLIYVEHLNQERLEQDAARIAAAAAKLLPQPERNNDQTALWGWRQHGARILVMLAIALEDPEVRSPCGYFGRLAGQDRGAVDLRLNLARILRTKGEVPPPEPAPSVVADGEAQARRLAEDLVAPPGTEDPKWQAIAVELRRILREGKFGSWFGRVGFGGVTDGVLTLSTISAVAADRIRSEFIPEILAAAEAADVFVERVVITTRKP